MSRRDDDLNLARQWMRKLSSQALAPVTHRPPAGKVFIDVMIEGRRFQGMRDGNSLYIIGPDGGCALGVASINEAKRHDHMPRGWHICKYWHEATCAVPLTRAGMCALAVTFGLPIVPEARLTTPVDLFEAQHFYDSPAFAALHAWAVHAPRRLAGASGDTYLGLWPQAALEGRYVAPTKENVARARTWADRPSSAGMGAQAAREKGAATPK